MKPSKTRQLLITSLLLSGKKGYEVAAEVGVSTSYVSKIKRRFKIEAVRKSRTVTESKKIELPNGRTDYKSKYTRLSQGEFNGAF